MAFTQCCPKRFTHFLLVPPASSSPPLPTPYLYERSYSLPSSFTSKPWTGNEWSRSLPPVTVFIHFYTLPLPFYRAIYLTEIYLHMCTSSSSNCHTVCLFELKIHPFQVDWGCHLDLTWISVITETGLFDFIQRHDFPQVRRENFPSEILPVSFGFHFTFQNFQLNCIPTTEIYFEHFWIVDSSSYPPNSHSGCRLFSRLICPGNLLDLPLFLSHLCLGAHVWFPYFIRVFNLGLSKSMQSGVLLISI